MENMPGTSEEKASDCHRIGLVLEGGAMRGLFTAGVLDVFMENGIGFGAMAGVSAGAAFGCNLKSRQIGRALRYNKKYCGYWRYCSLRSLMLTGDLIGADYCYHYLPSVLDPFDWKSFSENPMDFYVVATDMDTGKPVYHKCTETGDLCLEWIRASSSMPVVSRIVEINGGRYMDGAVADSIPLEFMEKTGYGKNVVILTQPSDYEKEKQSLMWLIKRMYRKYPDFIKAFSKRHTLYNDQREYVEKRAAEGAAFIIRPEKALPIKRLTNKPELIQLTYDMGRETAMRSLENIRKWMS